MSLTKSQLRSALVVAAFTVVYLTVASIAAWGAKNSEFVLYIAVLFLLMAMVSAIHWRFHLSLPILWALSLWGLAHMAGGLLPVPESWPIEGDIRVLYSLWLIPRRLKYDQLVHAYGFYVTTWVCWQVLRAVIARHAHQSPTDVRASLSTLILCAAASMGFGAMNEVIEFAATLAIPETNVGGYTNTAWDLVSNMVGACLAAVTIWIVDRARPKQ